MHQAGPTRRAVGMQTRQVLAHVHGGQQVHPQLLQRHLFAEVAAAVGLEQRCVVHDAAQAQLCVGLGLLKHLGHALGRVEGPTDGMGRNPQALQVAHQFLGRCFRALVMAQHAPSAAGKCQGHFTTQPVRGACDQNPIVHVKKCLPR